MKTLLTSTPLEKAQAINNDFAPSGANGEIAEPGAINYRGVVAEIGAGQEVARLFFEALGSRRTIIKTISAYGQGYSDAIYGEVPSYICEERLDTMFDHEYPLLFKRSLTDDEKPKEQDLRYFVFANTVDINRHGWAAVRVQLNGSALSQHPGHEALEYRIHFEILANDKSTKIRIVGALGVNLIHSALLSALGTMSSEGLVASLMDNIEPVDIRIDLIQIKKFKVNVEVSQDGEKEVHVDEVDTGVYGTLSQNMCIELVKASTAHCIAFTFPPANASVPSYSSLGKSRYLVFTRSSCEMDGLGLELEMLRCAKRAFLTDLLAINSNARDSDIALAIHLPILGALPPDTDQTKLHVYIHRESEPKANREVRRDLIQSALTSEISCRVERVTREGVIAFLSEYSASSEIVKFLRTKTRLSPDPIACVLRTDQLVEFLVNIEQRFKDREPLEILGSLIRRRARLYIYPCAVGRILQDSTRFGAPLAKAFTDASRKGHAVHPERRVGSANLRIDLLPTYSSLIAYMCDSGSLQDLQPSSDEYTGVPLRGDLPA